MSENASSLICCPVGPLSEIAAIEREQPLPMPLGRVAVVDRPLRKRKTVMSAGIDLDLVVRAFHPSFHLVDDFLWGVNVGLGATEIKLGLGLAGGEMRAVGLLGCEMRAVDRCGGLDAIRKMRRRVDGIAPAHAIADGADDACVPSLLAFRIGQHGLGV